jgi:UDP-3-O-[3-hydroxymyristoyl] N-acetylglucosamine deacetylase
VQHTLLHPIHFAGTGLHSGQTIAVTMKPAAVHTGIVFLRTDIRDRNARIEARWDAIVDTRLCSVLGNAEGVTVGTVEHLLAACAGLGLDNALIEIDGPEIPIMDGSAEPFVFLIECAGLKAQEAPRRVIEILKPVAVADGDKRARLVPSAEARVTVAIDFADPAIGRQSFTLSGGGTRFKHLVSAARTFGFLHEVETLRQAGLARGGSLENAVVISNGIVLNESGLRFADEFARHKVLDVVGDLALAGHPILGAFEGEKNGHALNNALLRALFAEPGAWRLIDEPVAEARKDWALGERRASA